MDDILDELKFQADLWDDHDDQEMSVFFVRCIGEIRKLRDALRPFAEHPEFQAPDEWAVTVIDRNEPTGEPVAGVTAGDFRRAAAAMIRERVTEAQRAEYEARGGKAWFVAALNRKRK